MMEDDVTPQSPEMQVLPAAPTVGQLAAEAGQAQGTAFSNAMTQLPQYGQMLTDVQGQQAPQFLQQYLNNQKVGGPALVGMAVDAVKQADPTGFQLRESLMQRVAGNLASGGDLTEQQRRNYQDDFRQSQINRGFGTGLADSYEESAFMNAQRQNMENQRIQQAMQALSGRTPMDFFGQVNQAGKIAPFQDQNIQGMAQNLIPSTAQMMGFGQNAYGQNMANINSQNQMKQHQFEYGDQNTYNPLMEDMRFGLEMANGVSGLAGTAVGTAAKAYTGCWVAIEIYGENSPITHRVRAFVHRHLGDKSDLGKFCRDYLEQGIEWAKNVKNDMNLRRVAKNFWDALNELALKEAL